MRADAMEMAEQMDGQLIFGPRTTADTNWRSEFVCPTAALRDRQQDGRHATTTSKVAYPVS